MRIPREIAEILKGMLWKGIVEVYVATAETKTVFISEPNIFGMVKTSPYQENSTS